MKRTKALDDTDGLCRPFFCYEVSSETHYIEGILHSDAFHRFDRAGADCFSFEVIGLGGKKYVIC